MSIVSVFERCRDSLSNALEGLPEALERLWQNPYILAAAVLFAGLHIIDFLFF